MACEARQLAERRKTAFGVGLLRCNERVSVARQANRLPALAVYSQKKRSSSGTDMSRW